MSPVPESQYSLELELPISKSGTREPPPPKKPKDGPASKDASLVSPDASPVVVSSSQETRDETPESEPTFEGDETLTVEPSLGLSSPIDQMASPEETESRSQGESLGPSQVESPGTESGQQTERSSESAVQDSPTTETTETEETGETHEEEDHEPHRFQFVDEQTPVSMTVFRASFKLGCAMGKGISFCHTRFSFI